MAYIIMYKIKMCRIFKINKFLEVKPRQTLISKVRLHSLLFPQPAGKEKKLIRLWI